MSRIDDTIISLEGIEMDPSSIGSRLETVVAVAQYMREGLSDIGLTIDSDPQILHAVRALRGFLASVIPTQSTHAPCSKPDRKDSVPGDSMPARGKEYDLDAVKLVLEAALPLILGKAGADCLQSLLLSTTAKGGSTRSAGGALKHWLEVQGDFASACSIVGVLPMANDILSLLSHIKVRPFNIYLKDSESHFR